MIYQNVGLINTVDFKNLNNGVNAKNIDIL